MTNESGGQKVLIAQPNLSNLTAEVQVEVANSPAFQCLEENFYRGNCTGTEVALLKMKYAQLYDALTRSRENEYNLLQTSKRFIAVLEVQQAELAKSDQFPDNISTTVSRLRCDYLRTENNLMATDERVEKLLYKLDLMKNEKKMLQREYSRMPKHELDNLGDEDIIEAMHRRTKTLTLENSDLHIEIDKLKRERHRLSENLRVSLEQESDIKDKKNQSVTELEKVKNDLFNEAQMPGQYSKEYEKLRRHKLDAEKELATETDNVSEASNYLQDFIHNRISIEKDINNTKNQIATMEKEIIDMNNLIKETQKLTRIYREQEMNLRTDKASNDLEWSNLSVIRKEYMEFLVKGAKEKEKLQKTVKMTVMQLNIANESRHQAQMIYEKVQLKYYHFPKEDFTFRDSKNRLTDETAMLKAALEEEVVKETVISSKVNHIVSEADRRLSNLDNYRSECVELVKLSQKIADRREKAANDFLCAERRFKRLQDELESKSATIQEQRKQLDRLELRAAGVAQLYSEVKMERNKCVALLQITNQAHLEKKERLRLKMNEQSIIYTKLGEIQLSLEDLDKDIICLIAERDNMRNEICRVEAVNIDMNYKREVMRLTIQRLNNMFNKIEADVIQTKKMTEKNILFRNERAMQLIERNEEKYIIEERTKLQESRYRNAHTELQALEIQIACLNRYKKELVNNNELLKRKVPVNESLKEETIQMDLQNIETRKILDKLVRRVEDPECPGRLRFLEGHDLNPSQLQNKVNVVEQRLVNQEERLLEKDLLFEAVSRLVDQVQLRSIIGKTDTINVAKTVNQIKTKIMAIDKQLRIKTADLTMKMTESHKLKLEIDEHNRILNSQYDRLQRSRTPAAELKQEYHRQKRNSAIKREYKRTKHIKKKIYPNPQSSRLFFNPHAPEHRLPPLREAPKVINKYRR